ncbi:MAG: hypothetical protein LBO66_01730 [Deltaproteobacteria bacterium]|jgi:hypothetical protein|nr:hypothetical protein [Deltaproteobacteria bacterium]
MDKNESPRVLRPALAGSWFQVLGIFLGISIVYFERDPEGRATLWIALSLFFLCLFLYRLGMKYVLNSTGIAQIAFFGLAKPRFLEYRHITDVETRHNFATGVVGLAHVIISSGGLKPVMILIAQKEPEKLKENLARLARAQRIAPYGPVAPPEDAS